MEKSISSKITKDKWFTPLRGSYLPKSWQGMLLYALFAVYLVFVVFASWQNTSSLSMAILVTVPNWVVAAVVLTWIAKHTS